MINFFKKRELPKTPEEILSYAEGLEKRISSLSKELKELKEKNKLCVKKVAVKRYNPFSNVGGNQSFSVALLDENNDGMIISSLFSQDGNRVYAKSLKNGKPEYQLSKEEEELIKQIIKNG